MNNLPSKTCKNMFLQQLQNVYSQYKKCYELNNSIFGESGKIILKKQKESRTRSKSLIKKKQHDDHQSPVRKSSRLCTKRNEQSQNFCQIDKQPLWHIKRRKTGQTLSKQKISKQVTIKQNSLRYRLKNSIKLYENYQQYDQKYKNEQQSQQKTKQKQKQQYHINQIEIKNILNQINQSEIQQIQVQEWIPSKMDSSLLAIQKLIDQYFIFKTSMRGSQVAKLSDVIMYVTDVNGYFFNADVLNCILNINPKLYKIITMHKEKYIKCRRLTERCVHKRQLSSKIKMKRRLINSQQLINIGK